MSPLEIVAFTVSVLGVWLTTRRSLWNFPFSLASVGLYAVIFHQVKLYADMALQCVFAGTLLYGLWQWNHSRKDGGDVLVARASAVEWASSLAAGLVAAAVIGYFLSAHTDASFPWADSSLLAGSLIGSLWVASRKLESWWLWIVVDTLYVGLYLSKHLYLTAALYAAFVVLAVMGLRRWHAALERQAGNPATDDAPSHAPLGSAATSGQP